jgi:hypothetical protein
MMSAWFAWFGWLVGWLVGRVNFRNELVDGLCTSTSQVAKGCA